MVPDLLVNDSEVNYEGLEFPVSLNEHVGDEVTDYEDAAKEEAKERPVKAQKPVQTQPPRQQRQPERSQATVPPRRYQNMKQFYQLRLLMP